MTFSPMPLVLTLLGGLLLAAILGWIRKPRLIVLVPRLFSYSRLTERGQMADITVFNRGFKTEEAIELSLNPNLSYEVLGSNSQDVDLRKNKLSIARIGPGDEVATLLLVEGGIFTSADITNCLSKDTKGRTVAKLEEVTPTGPQRIGLVAAILFFGALMGAVSFGIDWLLASKSEEAKPEVVATERPKILDVKGWQVPTIYEDSELLAAFSDGRISVEIGEIKPIKGGTSVPIKVNNRTDTPIKLSLSIERIGVDYVQRLHFDSSVHDVIIADDATVERRLTIGKGDSSSEDTIYVEVSFRPLVAGDSLTMLRAVPGK